MILKLLLVGAVIYVVYRLFFKQKKSYTPKKDSHNEAVNELIECPTCGVYVEVEEAILSAGKYYCSSECVRKAS